jgi:tRNA pseudouridine38/39 synthase
MELNDTKEVETDAEKIKRLETTVYQLKNVIRKLTGQGSSNIDKSSKNARPFDFSIYCKRHVLFQVCYFGWDYHGFAIQETSGKTIESELFKALTLTKLIKSREESNYHRCGRTDKGVSAFHQVRDTHNVEGLVNPKVLAKKP